MQQLKRFQQQHKYQSPQVPQRPFPFAHPSPPLHNWMCAPLAEDPICYLRTRRPRTRRGRTPLPIATLENRFSSAKRSRRRSLAYSSTLGPSEAEFFRGSQAEGPSQIGLEKSKVQGVMTGYISDLIINDSEVGLINTL